MIKHMFEKAQAMEPTRESAWLHNRIADASRAEAQAAAERLIAIAELFDARIKDSGECADLALDTHEAVAAQVAATLRISIGMAASELNYALAMRDRVPMVGAAFEAGDIGYALFRTIVFRTGIITDAQVLAEVDAQLAARVTRWPSMSRAKLKNAIDRVVAALDRDAVRRPKTHIADRYVEVGETDAGMAEIAARVFDTTGKALDRRLDELAGTVCEADPRTRDLRRADALDALIAGAERLQCRCGQPGCPAAAARRPAGNVVIHVVAEQTTIDGRSQAPGYCSGSESLIPAEVLREIAQLAKHLPIIAPTQADPEPRYAPSRALADYVRWRDLTCRAPGCNKPAEFCDIDHTVPHPHGPTHASNLKCLCREHHLLKTFWGWRDEQLPDGTVIWTLPDGQRHVTTPGSALLFPALCAPTGALPTPSATNYCTDRHQVMPRRTRTRAQNRAHAIETERRQNREARRARQPLPHDASLDPPPF